MSRSECVRSLASSFETCIDKVNNFIYNYFAIRPLLSVKYSRWAFRSHMCSILVLQQNPCRTTTLTSDHPSYKYDHISCDGQCFMFVRSLTSDHPSDATSDRVRWNFHPRGRPHRVFQNDCGINVRQRAAHFRYTSNRWQYSTNTKRLRMACKSG